MTERQPWGQYKPGLERWLEQHREGTLKAYDADPLLVTEHANQEDSYRTGGYAERQLLELVQNAADAQHSGDRGRVEVHLVGDTLYCANEGKPFSQKGLEAICHAHISDKREDEIGRFGLGFKSVLAVTSRPAIFSRSICFDFDAQRAERDLRVKAPNARRFPVLRLPALIDVLDEMRRDPILRELGDWAETVVRLPLSSGVARLEKELKDFRIEFLLFVPGVSSLRTVVDRSSVARVDEEHACLDMGDDTFQLQSRNREPSNWRVWHRIHRPSAEALLEVGEAIRRDKVRISWAAPLTGDVTQLGNFWAYFPLSDVTSVRGILNAPWQINDDRTNLLHGRFNQELLETAADIVVQGLPMLSDPEDPARHFDYLPARGREAPNFADRFLSERIPQVASSTACVPDVEGQLRHIAELRFPHSDDIRLDQDLIDAWYSAPGRPVAAPHLSCYRNTVRQARLRYLLRADDAKASEVELAPAAWLEQIVRDGTDVQCASAVRVVMAAKDEGTQQRLARARVLPDTKDQRHRLNATKEVFLRGDVLTGQAGIDIIRESLLEIPEVEGHLRTLGFVDVDPGQELGRLVRTVARDWRDHEWRVFWDLVQKVGSVAALEHLEEHVAGGGLLKVLCRDGSWHNIGEVVVIGVVEPKSEALVLDDRFHVHHIALLQQVGVSERPVFTVAALQDLTHSEYVRKVREHYLKQFPARSRPKPSEVGFHMDKGAGPLHVLRRFQDTHDPESCMGWSRELLALDGPIRVQFGHRTRMAFEKIEALAPHLWAVKNYGLLATAWGARPASQALGRGLAEYSTLLPVAEWESTNKLTLTDALEDVPLDVWREFLDRVPIGSDPWSLGKLLAEAARRLPKSETPGHIPALSGSSGCLMGPSGILIAHDEDEVRALVQRGLPYVALGDERLTSFLTETWGCQPASSRLRLELIAEGQGEPVILLDRYRGLRSITDGRLDGVELVECEDLFRQVTGPDGVDREPADLIREERVVYYRATLGDEDLLAELSQEFELQLTTIAISRILLDAQDQQIRTRMALCRNEPDHAKKLLQLLDIHVLESRLPAGLMETVRRLGKDTGETDVAQLLLHVHGYDVLRELRHDLESAGLPVPERWAGSSPAIGFVRQLGFPTEYAGDRGSHLEADLTVLGPPRLTPLHAFQEELAGQIRELVRSPGRGLLFLPTGAGKTRVTVQALSLAFTHDDLKGPLLWIAQSEELCEQAVQTWSTVWRELGDGRPMRLCRLWGRNEVADSEDEVTIVVATDAKLAICRNREDYAWLAKPTAIVIDEAHEATGTDYTQTLAWLGLDSRQTARPLLGLTATPFKGRSEDATKRLARRFGNRLLDVLGEDPYGTLQDLHVLSRVEHRLLDGAAMQLNAEEAEVTRRTRLLPAAVLERVGRDESRTQRLLEDIESLPTDWPVLVFTASVLSAQVLAALLRVRDVQAAAVSGMTRMHERRRSIEQFRRGDIQVLTNCNVLTQGFDAPGVRALYIARPTFSPNAYIQMVGRGLRGTANGGKDECLVVNVEDTFGLFGEELAYREFDYLWERQGGRLQ